MKKETKVRRGREFWAATIKEQSQSGLSVANFCRDKGLEQVTFYAWRKRFGAVIEASAGVKFTRIAVKAPPIVGSEVLLPGGLVLRFSGLTPVDYLRQLSAVYVVV